MCFMHVISVFYDFSSYLTNTLIYMNNLVVKDNILIEASHRLGEVEQRLILLAILQARKLYKTVEALKGQEITIHSDEYIQTFNVSRQNSYMVLKKAVINLFRAEWGYKTINKKGEPHVAYRRFIQSADYIKNGAVIKFRFSDDIIPLLVELEKRFTTYDIAQVARLSSLYSMRLYEFFMQHLNKDTGKGWLDISLEDLRFRLGLLPNEYRQMGDFKKRVLEFALNEINDKTDLNAIYIQKKHGRRIIGFRFEFSNQDNPLTRKQTSNNLKNISNEEEEPQRIEIMIAKFESLSSHEQEHILDEIAKHIDGPFNDLYKQARAQGTAHKDKMFIYWFLKILDC